MKKVVIFFLLLNIIGLIIVSFYGKISIINFEVAFFSSLLVTIGSYLGYKKNIENRCKNAKKDLRDDIDKIEDPYDLYSEDEDIDDPKEIIKIEKEKLKKNSFKNTLKSLSAFSSIYRLLGYALLVVGFFYLTNNHIFNPFFYLIGLSVVPLGALFYKFIKL